MHVDMPIAELYNYEGKSPLPNDFDQYWDRALEELKQQPLDYKLVESDFKSEIADCYHLYFTGVGGAKVHAKFVRPKEKLATGQGVVMFHGYYGDSGDWLDKLAYAAEGITVIALDCRGQAGLSNDSVPVTGPTIKGHIIRGLAESNPDQLYYRHVYLDTVQATWIMMSMNHIDTTRVGAYGQSQGGALAIACASLEPRIKQIFAVHPFLADFKRVWEMDVTNTAYEELSYYFRAVDPTHQTADQVFNRLGYIDIQNLSARIQGDVKWVTGLRDHVCPPSTQFAAYNKITANKDMTFYPEHGHEHLPRHGDQALQWFKQL